MTVSRPLQVDFSKEDDLRQLAVTLTARSILVVSHHLDGLRRVTASGVLQPVPVRVRCVSDSTDPHHLGKPKSEGTREEPFPQRGHPSKNLCRRQATTPLGVLVTLMRLPPIWCRPEGLSPMLGPLQGITPSMTVDRLAHRCRFTRWSASFHGLLFPDAPPRPKPRRPTGL
jgi:hypothetical protein